MEAVRETTMKLVVLSTKAGQEETFVQMHADYNDGRNKEWARWTPAANLQFSVKNELADRFPQGQAFLVTFTPES